MNAFTAFPGLAAADHAPAVRPAIDRGTDRDLFLVECYGYRRRNTYFSMDAYPSTADAVEAILSGNVEDVKAVFQFNPVEGWSRDVSSDMAEAVVASARKQYRPITRSVQDYIEHYCGCGADRGLEVV